MQFRELGSLGAACRATRDFVDGLPIWERAAEKLGWPEPTSDEDRRKIKARVMTVGRRMPGGQSLACAQQLSTWKMWGRQERRAIGAWPRLLPEQQVARLLIATPEAAISIVGSLQFRPSPQLLQTIVDRGVSFKLSTLAQVCGGWGRGWGDVTGNIVADNVTADAAPPEYLLVQAISAGAGPVVRWSLSNGLQPTSDHLLAAAKGGDIAIATLLWEAGGRPNDEAWKELSALSGPMALQITMWRVDEQSAPPSPEGSSDGELPLKRARQDG